MNHSVARFQRIMHHLALVAMVLMLCMPVLSRWQQGMAGHTGQGEPDMCLSEGSHVLLDMQAAPTHRLPEDTPSSPDHHHDACGYCTLVTRMLPVLALLLVLPLPLHTRHRVQLALPVPPAAPAWRAHRPRGPPIYL